MASRPVAQVAQLVEHATENRSVGGSIPPLGTTPSTNPLKSQRNWCFLSRLSKVGNFERPQTTHYLTDARLHDPSDFTWASASRAVAACLAIHFSKTLRAARSLRYSRP